MRETAKGVHELIIIANNNLGAIISPKLLVRAYAAEVRLHPKAQTNRNHFLFSLSVKYPMSNPNIAVAIEQPVPATKAYCVESNFSDKLIEVKVDLPTFKYTKTELRIETLTESQPLCCYML